MVIPNSTYRLQFSSAFTFHAIKEVVDYLHKLGISTIYASPIFQARKGSTHGYDVTNPWKINPEIGTLDDLNSMHSLLKEKGMGWLQDIVPNHMAFDASNPLLHDIFEFGPQSEYYNFFDINWDYPSEKEKIIAPFLGKDLKEAIEDGDFTIRFDEHGVSFHYFDHVLPASIQSCFYLLKDISKKDFQNASHPKRMKEEFLEKINQDPEIKELFLKKIEAANNSPELMMDFIQRQFFMPAHWKTTEKEINYRRFFTINDLICLKMEDQEVFEKYHSFIGDLCASGIFQGLRIDHIDGLFDPAGYLEKLRRMAGPDFYIIIEKILEWDEDLPNQWPIQGTSGYDFLATVNNLFIQSKNEEIFSRSYLEIDPHVPDYKQLVYQEKLFILKERMGGELQNLWRLFKELDLLPANKEIIEENWQEALSVFLAAFPVYRIYPSKFPLTRGQKKIIEQAFSIAVQQAFIRKPELEEIRAVLTGEADKDPANMIYFLKRCQQFTGPLAAKGVEDTSFYNFNKLISLNEVGDSPHFFGISIPDFHERMKLGLKYFPHSINATATHDTKRGEDARMRINTLSEIPDLWFRKVNEWRELNKKLKKEENIPDSNEEYFIYQALIGSLPFEENTEDEFFQRTKNYLQKVLREAKLHTNWSSPDEEYEEKVYYFLEQILKSEEFMSSFNAFRKPINKTAVIYSIGQCLIKATAPGVPDIYQGTELWDFSYVDPDNRRPVDYDQRRKYLDEIEKTTAGDLQKYLLEITTNFASGKIKLFTLYNILQERKKNPETFGTGEYVPMKTKGKEEFAIAFARKTENIWYVTVAPLGVYQAEEKEWKDHVKFKEASIVFPEDAPDKWTNVFSSEVLEIKNKKISADRLFRNFPVALLRSESFLQ